MPMNRNELGFTQHARVTSIAIVGMKDVQTVHISSLCDPKNPSDIGPMVFPDPVISIAIAT